MVVYPWLTYGVTPLSFNNCRGLSAKVNHLPNLIDTCLENPGAPWNAIYMLGHFLTARSV
jgi:hypothetical protein